MKGIPADWQPDNIRQMLLGALDQAQAYLAGVPEQGVGCLALDGRQTPVEITGRAKDRYVLRRPTEEPEVLPQFKDIGPDWRH